MSWEVPEGRHYCPRSPGWWYWERRGSGPEMPARPKLIQGNYMSQHETGYGASGVNGGDTEYGGYGSDAATQGYASREGYQDEYGDRTAVSASSGLATAADYRGSHGGGSV